MREIEGVRARITQTLRIGIRFERKQLRAMVNVADVGDRLMIATT
jgi:hypothetical protein